ncbi:MAG TPA: D-2-hydroxyacid dehydrogenase [Polyangiaceae bacterium]|nr:D-2-hydroxyacid dehydrogenase [Polyangiaceae bacterium]
MPRLVVLDAYTLNPGDNPWTPVEAHGDLVVFERSARGEVLPRAHGADVLLTNKTPLDAATLAALPGLRGICVLATGVNVVDVPAATARGVPVCNIPAYSTASTAQHTIALLLELTNHVGRHDRAVHAGEWVRALDFTFTLAPFTELDGLVLGVVGFGAIGRRVAEIARALGMQIQAAGEPGKPSDPPWLRRVPLEELFRSSDVVTLHCPLSDATRELVNAVRLAQMRPDALLINAGRGQLVNEAELADALERGAIAGAALDVLSGEPPRADNPLLTARNCVITPHNAWLSLAARRRAMRITADNVAGILNGAPQNVVNPGAISGSRD